MLYIIRSDAERTPDRPPQTGRMIAAIAGEGIFVFTDVLK